MKRYKKQCPSCGSKLIKMFQKKVEKKIVLECCKCLEIWEEDDEKEHKAV
jgi:transcription initiation factor TFIIIB Brf1 subunit/transcription initiation factor TFIIB